MKGYFLHLAQLALGTGPRVETRPVPDWEDGGWEEAEADLSTRAGDGGATPVMPIAATVNHEFHRHTAKESHSQSIIDHEVARESLRAKETINNNPSTLLESQTTLERRETELRRETRESLRELVREAQTIKEREVKETFHVEGDRAKGLARHSETERKTEIQKLVREVESATRTREIDRIHETRVEAAEPTVEIHIGRIEVRAPAPATKKDEKREKPTGVIDLDEYLRERRKGNT